MTKAVRDYIDELEEKGMSRDFLEEAVEDAEMEYLCDRRSARVPDYYIINTLSSLEDMYDSL